MRTGFRMTQEAANALVQLGRNDVLEFAGLVACLGVVDGKRIFEQPLRKTMTPHHVARAAAARRRLVHFAIAQRYQMQIGHAAQNARGRFVGQHRKMPRGSGSA
jgi:hypothetical protein